MMSPFDGPLGSFISEVREHLLANLTLGVIEGFSCTVCWRKIYSASLFNGERHSKAPLQLNAPFDLSVSLLLPAERGVEFSLESSSMSMFIRQFEFALSQAAPLEHRIRLSKQSEYPKIQLASDDLLNLFSNGQLTDVILDILERTERYAAEVNHPRLMNREVSVVLSICDKIYFDSLDNSARETSASCSTSCSFSLEDSAESHNDVFGIIPSDDDLKNVVDIAAKNLIRSQVKALSDDAHLPVFLTHKAVIDLLDQLVVPNLEARSLIDKTGAWELDQVGQVVVQGLSIEDNPHIVGSPFSSLFDFEGTPTRPVRIMSAGQLVHPLMTSALLEEIEDIRPEWKGRFQLTGHALSPNETSFTNVHFCLECLPLGDLSQESYIQIQNLTGMSLDPLTGQFALDADGAKVFHQGQLLYSTSLTLRGNFFDALVDESTRAGSLERHFNQWAPSLFTRALSCVSKELAQTFED